jgi:hypothetical protein
MATVRAVEHAFPMTTIPNDQPRPTTAAVRDGSRFGENCATVIGHKYGQGGKTDNDCGTVQGR